MKLLRSSVIVFISILLLSCGTEKQTETNDWFFYGQDFTTHEPIPLTKAVAELEKYEETPVLVEGTISAVCQSRGCWMLVKEGDTMVRVRFIDYSFFVPWESKGKEVRIEGTMKKEVISEDLARHWAEEAEDPDFAPEDIHGEQEMIIITASAVAIKGGTEISPEQHAVISGEQDTDHTH